MLILSQEAWSAGDPARLGQIVGAAVIEARRKGEDGDDWTLLLLPHSGVVWPEPEAFSALSALAARHAIHLAGSLALEPAAGGAVAAVGFVFGPGGELALRTGKIAPDLIEGFGETQALPAAEADFPVSRLPFAQVGMLLGEDILFSHYARALVFGGAEVICHSSSGPHGAEGRSPWDNARRLRAFENTAYMISAIDGGEHVAEDSDLRHRLPQQPPGQRALREPLPRRQGASPGDFGVHGPRDLCRTVQ